MVYDNKQIVSELTLTSKKAIGKGYTFFWDSVVNILNICFRITPSHVVLSKLVVFLQIEHVLTEEICEHSATEANGRKKNLTN